MPIFYSFIDEVDDIAKKDLYAQKGEKETESRTDRKSLEVLVKVHKLSARKGLY